MDRDIISSEASFDMRYRPRYHLLPESNWINDPNGPIFWKGLYRMFYQHNPSGPLWGNIHWGYAYSMDMVHWIRATDSLTPGPEPYDSQGVFSGCTLDYNGKLVAYYTGNAPQTQCLAFGTLHDDNTLSFQKYHSNPIIPAPPPGFDTKEFRDPFVWKEGPDLRMILASGYNGTGIIFSYRSTDGISWKYEGIFHSEKFASSVPSFECPLFFSIGHIDYLVISPYSTPIWLSGDGSGREFQVTSRGLLDASLAWYAPNTFLAEDGRRIIIGWLREERPDTYLLTEGWAGCLSLPRELFPLQDGSLGCRPIRELETLRMSTETAHPGKFYPNEEYRISSSCSQVEIDLTLDRKPESIVEIALFQTRDGYIKLTLCDADIVLDCSGVSRNPDIHPIIKRLSLPFFQERISLRIFLDHSTVEVFIDETYCVSSRAYPPDPDTGHASIRVCAGSARLVEGKAHRLLDGI